jgi:xanthine dehydrogenase accessory factor
VSAVNLPIFRKALEWRHAGRAVAMAAVIETWGSAPSPVGSHLVTEEGGEFLGSVSGGCVETDVIGAALDVMQTKAPSLLEFGIADETAWRAGLSCGGRLKVFVEHVGAAEEAEFAVLVDECVARRACVRISDIDPGERRLVRASEAATDRLAELLTARLRDGRGGLIQESGRRLFFDVQMPSVRLVLIGATHIAQTLSGAASLAGFEVTVVDPRSAFATPERFPGTPVVADWPETALRDVGLDGFTAVALLAHDPRIDDPALAAALRAKCFYIGALGSKITHAKRLERMRTAGFCEADLALIRAPIGLPIGAANGAEIAIAVLAEIIAVLRQGNSRVVFGKAG